jgi:hypothetical protein
LLASEQGATTSFVACLALEQSAIVTFLFVFVIGVFLAIHFGGVGFVTQASGLRIGLSHHGLGQNLTASQQGGGSQTELNRKPQLGSKCGWILSDSNGFA